MIWRAIFWFFRLLPLVALGVFLHFYLPHKDVVRIADTELVFCQVSQNPLTLGLETEFAGDKGPSDGC